MRRLIADIFDPGTRYDYEIAVPKDIVRALELDARFVKLNLGLVDGMVALSPKGEAFTEFLRQTAAISDQSGSVHV